MWVYDDQRLFSLALANHFIRQEFLQPFSDLAILEGRDVLHSGRRRREPMQRFES